MNEITGPVIAITLVLSSVFIPTAFIAGITREFYKQFALTIAASTIISAINAMTMAPARALVLIKPHMPGDHSSREALPNWGVAAILGYLVYRLLGPIIAPLVGIHLPAGHGHEPVEHETAAATVWIFRAVLFGVGALISWLCYSVINRTLLAVLTVSTRSSTGSPPDMRCWFVVSCGCRF